MLPVSGNGILVFVCNVGRFVDQSRLVKLIEPHLIRIRIPDAGQEVLRNIRIHCGIERQLPDVARAFDALRLFAGLIQGRKQHRRENRDDRYCGSLKSGIFFAIFCNFCFQGSMRNDRLQ